ncbi:uncharacterized protein EV420DRAFT_310822 [Desarmillaria tabescens]|uniref:Uncharacterized protein n=1 Tax=Armillaria tabescens TaxID=1929756 RepID=A0AA39KE04_ARMTA|nr:uncharacterized protein EV420DRAFT_310822 [Desarmillaria tabescens]KAK0459252.1 hypothetical protein EV420DRAFT_310822 [Desarmillaria tabescens]
MMSRFYGLDWTDVCDYLGLDSDKGDEQFRKKYLTCINLPESVQEEMHDMIGPSVQTGLRPGGKLDLASIKKLVPPGITMRHKVDGSDATVRLLTLELRPKTGVSHLRPRFIDILFRCRSQKLISAILEMVQKCLPNVPESSTTSSQSDNWTSAHNTAQEVHEILATTMKDSERENALVLLRDNLSALNPQGVNSDVYRCMREDQIRKNEEHRRYRNREFELAQQGEGSGDISQMPGPGL